MAELIMFTDLIHGPTHANQLRSAEAHYATKVAAGDMDAIIEAADVLDNAHAAAGDASAGTFLFAEASEAERSQTDAKLAARLRTIAATAKASAMGKHLETEVVRKQSERVARQASVVESFKEQDRLHAERVSRTSAFTSTDVEKVSRVLAQTTAQRVPGIEDPTKKKTSKIHAALNPKPLYRQTVGDRRDAEDNTHLIRNNFDVILTDDDTDDEDGANESTISAAEKAIGEAKAAAAVATAAKETAAFAKLPFWKQEQVRTKDAVKHRQLQTAAAAATKAKLEEEASWGNMELDAATEALLEKNKVERAASEAGRAAVLAASHNEAESKKASQRADELAVITARSKMERKASSISEAELIAKSMARVASEIKFDFHFFAEGDTDGDGMLSLEEATAKGMSESVFQLIDTDGNGQLTKEEFTHWMHAPTAKTSVEIKEEATRRNAAPPTSIAFAEANRLSGITQSDFTKLDSDLTGRISILDFNQHRKVIVQAAKRNASAHLGLSMHELHMLHNVLKVLFPTGWVNSTDLEELISSRPGNRIADPAKYVREVFLGFDVDGTDTIDCTEFAVYIAMHIGRSVAEQLENGFCLFDVEESGWLSTDSVVRLLELMTLFDLDNVGAENNTVAADLQAHTLVCRHKVLGNGITFAINGDQHVLLNEFVRNCSKSPEVAELLAHASEVEQDKVIPVGEEKGFCDACGALVYTSQPRGKRNGRYFHKQCPSLISSTAANAATATAVLKPTASTGPQCGSCGKPVLISHARTKANNVYTHKVCGVAAVGPGFARRKTQNFVFQQEKEIKQIMMDVLAPTGVQGARPTDADKQVHADQLQVRGRNARCKKCGEAVLNTQPRAKVGGGYVHNDCSTASNFVANESYKVQRRGTSFGIDSSPHLSATTGGEMTPIVEDDGQASLSSSGGESEYEDDTDGNAVVRATAATVIQAAFKGSQVRKTLKAEHAAATVIQAAFKGSKVRKEVNLIKEVTTKVAGHGKVERKHTAMGNQQIDFGHLSKLFGKIDGDGNGRVDRSELRMALEADLVLCKQVAPHGIDALFVHLDTDSSGDISMMEFIKGITHDQVHGTVE
jgi:Ca2+-binding EF-hand superfamily protein